MPTSKTSHLLASKVSVSRVGEEIKRHKDRDLIRARGLALPNPLGNKDGFSVRKHRYHFLSHKSILYFRYDLEGKRRFNLILKYALDNPMPSVCTSQKQLIVSKAIG